MKSLNIKHLSFLCAFMLLFACTTDDDPGPGSLFGEKPSLYKGLLVGSTGHFNVKITDDEKSLTGVFEAASMTMKYKSEDVSGLDTIHTFEGDDVGNNIKIRIKPEGTAIVESINLIGHTDVAAVMVPLDGVEDTDSTDLQFFQGSLKQYGLRVANVNDVPNLNNKFFVFETHYNLIIIGNKYIFTTRLLTSNLAQWKEIWATNNIDLHETELVEDPLLLKRFVSGGTFTSKTATALTWVRNNAQGVKTSLMYNISTENSKSKLSFPLRILEGETVRVRDKTLAKTRQLKPLCVTAGTPIKYYKLKSLDKKWEHKAAAKKGDTDEIAFLENASNADEITEDDAKALRYPLVEFKAASESMLTEIE